jgi:hypothetical protein
VTICEALPTPPALNAVGDICRKDGQCESARCNGLFCEDAICESVADCPADFACAPPMGQGPSSSPRTCVLLAGYPCVTDRVCLGGSCEAGACTCSPLAASCLATRDCCRGTCTDGRCVVHEPVDAGIAPDGSGD